MMKMMVKVTTVNRILLRALIVRWKDVFIHWDFGLAVLITVIIGIAPNYNASEWNFHRLVWIEVTVAGALLGMVLAGVSILIALMREDFMIFLYRVGLEEDAMDDGMFEAILPFWFMAWLVVIVIISGILGIALVPSSCVLMQRIWLSWVTFFLAWAVFNVIPVVGFLGRLGQLRIDQYVASIVERERAAKDNTEEQDLAE